jgi:hypothetical protein
VPGEWPERVLPNSRRRTPGESSGCLSAQDTGHLKARFLQIFVRRHLQGHQMQGGHHVCSCGRLSRGLRLRSACGVPRSPPQYSDRGAKLSGSLTHGFCWGCFCFCHQVPRIVHVFLLGGGGSGGLLEAWFGLEKLAQDHSFTIQKISPGDLIKR